MSSLLPIPEKASIATEVLRLLALTESEFEAAFREAHPEIPEDLDLENDSIEIFELLLNGKGDNSEAAE